MYVMPCGDEKSWSEKLRGGDVADASSWCNSYFFLAAFFAGFFATVFAAAFFAGFFAAAFFVAMSTPPPFDL